MNLKFLCFMASLTGLHALLQSQRSLVVSLRFHTALHMTQERRERRYNKKVVADIPSKSLGIRGFASQRAPPKASKSKGRRAGNSQRRNMLKEENIHDIQVGRVSMYCVGAALDLKALRAAIFRRGFQDQGVQTSTDVDFETLPSLALAGDEFDSSSSDDDEVLHVSNASKDLLETREKMLFQQQGEMTQGVGTTTYNHEGNIDWTFYGEQVMSTKEIFYYDYGCVVMWGLSPPEERAVLDELEDFVEDACTDAEVQESFDTLEFVFDHKANPQRPIRFDRMRLRSLKLREKLALSYAMAQSSKLFVFESQILKSLDETRYLPRELAEQGSISCSKKELNMLIGQLFVEQTEVNLFSSILDTPDFLWEDDEHTPAYSYLRSYLEVDDRVDLLNSRLTVMRELLDVLQSQVESANSSRLEWIVIWLIAMEIIMGIISNPLFAGKRAVSSLFIPVLILLYKGARFPSVPALLKRNDGDANLVIR